MTIYLTRAALGEGPVRTRPGFSAAPPTQHKFCYPEPACRRQAKRRISTLASRLNRLIPSLPAESRRSLHSEESVFAFVGAQHASPHVRTLTAPCPSVIPTGVVGVRAARKRACNSALYRRALTASSGRLSGSYSARTRSAHRTGALGCELYSTGAPPRRSPFFAPIAPPPPATTALLPARVPAHRLRYRLLPPCDPLQSAARPSRGPSQSRRIQLIPPPSTRRICPSGRGATSTTFPCSSRGIPVGRKAAKSARHPSVLPCESSP